MSPTDSSFVPLATIPGLNDNITPTQQGIATFLNNLYTFAIGIAVILAVGMIIYGGVKYALSEVPSAKGDGKRQITQALFGLVLVLAPALVFGIINPAILNLQVNFEALHTTWGTSGQSSPSSNYTPNPYAPPVGGITDPKQTPKGSWCYIDYQGKYVGCQADKVSCQNSYDGAADPDRGDPSPPKSTCTQFNP
jgi:hypothetical protein